MPVRVKVEGLPPLAVFQLDDGSPRHRRHLHPWRRLARAKASSRATRSNARGIRASSASATAGRPRRRQRADQGLQDAGRGRPHLHRDAAGRRLNGRGSANAPLTGESPAGHRPTERDRGALMLQLQHHCPFASSMLSSLSYHSQSPAIALLASEPARAFVDLFASRAPHAPAPSATATVSSSIPAWARAPGAPGGCALASTPPASTASTGASA